MASAKPAEPLRSIDELVTHFLSGSRPAAQFAVGMEHEKIAVLADGRAPGYDVIGPFLADIAKRGNWQSVDEHGALIALHDGSDLPNRGNVTLEPGGQVEHSGAPWPSAFDAAGDNDRHLAELDPIAAAHGMTFLGVGFRPFGTLDEVPWMPKGRYKVMREYLPRHGTRGLEMMKRTATVQANLDYLDEADAMEKLRLGLGLSSLVTAMFAASPLVDGKPSGFQSYRANAWLDTDNDRCGLLRFAFEPGASFRHYAEWALDVPMFFLYRDGQYRALPDGTTFRRFLFDGLGGERATMADWELHLSTLFPEVRLKRYVEVRQADAGNREMARALPCLWRGVFYDTSSRHAAWDLVRDLHWDERVALYHETPRAGLAATVRGRPLVELCAELVAISAAGLIRLGKPDAAKLLDPLKRICHERRTQADHIVAVYNETGGDPKRMIAALKL
jgi:glutamate--cysteine ligase